MLGLKGSNDSAQSIRCQVPILLPSILAQEMEGINSTHHHTLSSAGNMCNLELRDFFTGVQAAQSPLSKTTK